MEDLDTNPIPLQITAHKDLEKHLILEEKAVNMKDWLIDDTLNPGVLILATIGQLIGVMQSQKVLILETREHLIDEEIAQKPRTDELVKPKYLSDQQALTDDVNLEGLITQQTDEVAIRVEEMSPKLHALRLAPMIGDEIAAEVPFVEEVPEPEVEEELGVAAGAEAEVAKDTKGRMLFLHLIKYYWSPSLAQPQNKATISKKSCSRQIISAC